MLTDEFDYPLAPSAIAQRPLDRRDRARLLVDRGSTAEPEHRHVADLAELLQPGDLLVRNTTRVLPARLALVKRTGGLVEVLLLEPLDDVRRTWSALVRPGRRVRPGTVLAPAADGLEGVLEVEVGADLGEGRRRVVLHSDAPVETVLDLVGVVPLPPYVTEALADPERYQTVFADRATSVAAPTAGLHLTNELFERCARRQIQVADVELAVGLGTFRPMLGDEVDGHAMHAERFVVPASTVAACAAARARGNQVVAVGTTVVRALESAAASGTSEGSTELFIRRGHRFALVDRLLTNFHLPRSTLLVMIDAFIGPRWRELYDVALADGYRFLSFGDAMLLDRDEPGGPEGG